MATLELVPFWFQPSDPALVPDPPVGRSVERNAGAFAPLRFEAIDALELHDKGAESNHDLAGARDFTASEAGFTSVTYAPELYKTVQASERESTAEYVLFQRFSDGRLNVDPYGRPVSFVFPGATARDSHPPPSGSVSLRRGGAVTT